MESGEGLVKSGLGASSLAMLRRLGTAVLDLAYPPQCLACGAPTASANALCASCFSQLRPITRPLCPRLGIPFEISLGPDALSAEAIADPPPYDRSRSAVVYNGVARAIVGRLKYGDRPEVAGFCARLMAPAGAEFWGSRPVLVPVPLHPSRQLARRYNQSTELARALAQRVGLPLAPGLVRRVRRTRQQVGLTAEGRHRNVAGAFAVGPGLLERLRGRGIVLVDDVITTGSTVSALTRLLQRAGVEKIDVISFARVVIGVETTI